MAGAFGVAVQRWEVCPDCDRWAWPHHDAAAVPPDVALVAHLLLEHPQRLAGTVNRRWLADLNGCLHQHHATPRTVELAGRQWRTGYNNEQEA